MRDFIKLFIVGVVLIIAPQVFAENYKLLILPDNIVTETAAIDSYIYDACAEYFADGVSTILDNTDSIASAPVSQVRAILKKDPSSMLTAKALTSRFKNSYNIDFAAVKKLASKVNARYVLMLTSTVDAQNYILRRTVWDFFNIPGASVVDPAYKISTYAVLVDTTRNLKLWEDTYYKTISVCENRIITRGPSPQTEQLEKIKDYSKYLCPQIARNVQLQLLPPNSPEIVDYGIGNIDNVFTKKYRHLGKETKKLYNEKKAHFEEFKEDRKVKKVERQERKQAKAELKVKATPVTNNIKKINYTGVKQTEPEPVEYKPGINTQLKTTTMTVPANYYGNPNVIDKNTLDGIDLNLKKHRRSLYDDFRINQPELRDYSK